MFGLVPFSALEIKWSDPIPWEEAGVFTAAKPNMMHDLVACFFICTFGFLVLFKTCELPGKARRFVRLPRVEQTLDF